MPAIGARSVPVEQVGGLGGAKRVSPTGAIGSGSRCGSRHALDEHGLHDVVARAGVGHEFVDAIGERQPWRPEVVVGIDDRAGRIDRLFRVESSSPGTLKSPWRSWSHADGRRAEEAQRVAHHTFDLSRREAPIGCPV